MLLRVRGWWLAGLTLLVGCRSTPDDASLPVSPAPAVRADPAPVVRTAARAPTRSPAPRSARTPDDAWARARPFDGVARRDLLSFFAALSDADLMRHFGVARSALPDAEVAARLRRDTFRFDADVSWSPRASGVYVLAEDAAPASVRLVWPIAIGDGLELTPHKPRVNAGTGSPVLRRHATWLFDLESDAAWLQTRSAGGPPLRFRALLQPRGARIDRHPVLVVRVVAWQVLDGSRLLHEETDDR